MTDVHADPRSLLSIRPGDDEYAPYYGKYISKVPDGDIVGRLTAQHEATQALLRDVGEARAGHRYAAGKWSIREVVGHMADAERIFAYRALRFARGDETPLPSFDENAYIAHAKFDGRTLRSLCDEFASVRTATIRLFEGLDEEEWRRRGVASGNGMSVRGAAWVIAGHELHHRGILEERYLGHGA